MSNERNDSGRFIERVSPDDVLNVIATQDEPVTATEIGDNLDVTNRAALNKLNTLHEQGRVKRKKVGGRSVVWWLTDAERTRGGPADPLYELIGMLDDDEADRLRERSRELREGFDERIEQTRDDLENEEQ